MKLDVRIEALVLRGLGAGRQHEMRAAMERALLELLRTEGAAESLNRRRDLAQLDAGSVHVTSTASGQAIGEQLAHSVYRSIVG